MAHLRPLKRSVSIAEEASTAAAWFFAPAPRPAAAQLTGDGQATSGKSVAAWFFSSVRSGPSSADPPRLPPRSVDGPRKLAPHRTRILHEGPGDLVDTKGKVIKFTNCRLVRGHALVRDDLWIRCAVCVSSPAICHASNRAVEDVGGQSLPLPHTRTPPTAALTSPWDASPYDTHGVHALGDSHRHGVSACASPPRDLNMLYSAHCALQPGTE